jgi:hypothetical protein
MNRSRWMSWLAACLPLLISGCTGGDVGSELTVRPPPRELPRGDAATLKLPADAKFNIALSPATKAPGLAGSADVDSEAAPDGNAACRAKIEGGGQGSATFQLGHTIKNATDRQTDWDVHARFDYDYRAAATPVAGPQATLSLNLFARDARNRLVQTAGVLQHTTEQGDISGSSREDARFTLTLAAGGTASVFLAGNVTIDAHDGQSGSGEIRVKGLEITLTQRPPPAGAPASRPAGP